MYFYKNPQNKWYARFNKINTGMYKTDYLFIIFIAIRVFLWYNNFRNFKIGGFNI